MKKSNWSGLRELQNKMKKLEQTRNVPFNELFDTSFMIRYTEYSNIDDFFKDGNFDFITNEDFEKISEETLNKHVKSNTSFENWNEMKIKAGEIWIVQELDF